MATRTMERELCDFYGLPSLAQCETWTDISPSTAQAGMVDEEPAVQKPGQNVILVSSAQQPPSQAASLEAVNDVK